ncbi:Gfo/Idh/MocA family protein [Saccharospirillum salsuginis]|uniref:Oxidoreductase n=1 Tax=Saccharospirillum salsuginis TaxID=418750 RepID=A0A918KRN7_9GAMM|nr:Gfo/Idh/MocA family oxidoreductase [Saccharospirillum salsuginis]GGX73145.1 oxidoreductase [Saccharospirillum salsuginis]
MGTSSIRTGLVGYGLSGRVFHAPFIELLEDFELTRVNSRNPDAVHQRYPNTEVTDDTDALIGAGDLDLIVITAPNDLHFPLAKAALEAGKHVLLEKPAVTRLEQMETLAELAERRNRVVTAYQNRRYDGDFLHLKQLIDSQDLGQLKHLDSRFDRFRPTPQQRWREQPGEGTGIFWDLGPHLIDQALALFGPPEALTANLKILRPGGQTVDWFDVQLHYAGFEITLGSTPFEAGDMRRYNARFENGSWQCWGLDPQEAALRADQMPWQAGYPSLGAEQTARRFSAREDGTVETTDDAPEPGHYRHYYRQLAAAIRGEDKAPVSTFEARALLYTLERAEESSRLGRRLAWDYG